MKVSLYARASLSMGLATALLGACGGGGGASGNAMATVSPSTMRSSTGSSPPAATPSGAATPTPSPVASGQPPASVVTQFQELNCATFHPDGNGPADQYVVACDKDNQVKYLLAPAKVIGTDVKSATATVPQGPNGTVTGDWIIQVSFTGRGQDKFTKLTQDTVGKQVAVELDGVVQSAPMIQDVIPGDAEISSNYTRQQAVDLANDLKYGALPLTFKPDTVTADSVTTVTLTPALPSGGMPPSGSIEQAVAIIRQRAAAFGGPSAIVTRLGDVIRISVPETTPGEVLNLLSATAELQFREVVTSAEGQPALVPVPSPRPTRT